MIDAIRELLPALLGTLDRIGWVQRHLYPPFAAQLAEELAPWAPTMAAPLRALEQADAAPEFTFIRERLIDVTRQTIEVVEAFVEGSRHEGDLLALYRPLRRFARVQESLYPLAPAFDPISRFFLEPSRRADDALVARLREAALRDGEPHVGVLHGNNDRDARGGFSLYVPELADGVTPMPLVVALHGGSGHGRDFLWQWVREARARSVLVLSPTARDRTWSIMAGEDVDADNVLKMIDLVQSRYPVDRTRILLTGMSDGATYTFLCGLREDAPFTHLAPACGVMHPFVFVNGGLDRARGRPIYLVHGALDWMFPVEGARQARDVLTSCGAEVVYREIEDLSHTYARDENPAILDWLMSPGKKES